MTIPEACQLVLEAGTMGEGGEIYIFDMGKSVKIVDLAKKMIKLSGLSLGEDIEIKFTGLRPGEKLYEELLNVAENTIATHHSKITHNTTKNKANAVQSLNKLSHSNKSVNLLGAQTDLNIDKTATGSVAEIKIQNNKQTKKGI